jgi:aspartate/methionine/tyrosine aminotransferase
MIEPFLLERRFARHEYTARSTLTASDCEPLAQSEVVALADDEARGLWEELKLAYTEYRGLGLLREEISGLYERISPDEVLVAAPEECIFLAMSCILEKGDRVICTWPGYQSLYELARSFGCEVERWQPDEESGWRFDPAMLRSMVKPGTRLIVVNFPHNPTGFMSEPAEFEEVVRIARECGAHLFSDEMYRLLELDPEARPTAACDLYEKGISLFGMSKSFGMAGARIGWLATRDAGLYRRMAAFKDYTTICSSAPSEVLSLIGLRAVDRIVGGNLQRIRRNLELLDTFFERRAELFDWVRPRGGTISFPRLLTGPDSPELCGRLLERTGLLLLDSTLFDFGRRHLRIGFGREDMPEALSLFEEYLDSL